MSLKSAATAVRENAHAPYSGFKVGAALKWEGIVNDPIGALFAVAAFEIIRVSTSGQAVLPAIAWIVLAAGLGTLLGIVFGLARIFGKPGVIGDALAGGFGGLFGGLNGRVNHGEYGGRALWTNGVMTGVLLILLKSPVTRSGLRCICRNFITATIGASAKKFLFKSE